MMQVLDSIRWDWRLTIACVLALVMLDIRLRRGYDLIVLDVLANIILCIIGALFALDPSMLAGSWKQTLSARAGSEAEKGQRYFAWTAKAIDALFGSGHCKAQWQREKDAGGVWAAWGKP